MDARQARLIGDRLAGSAALNRAADLARALSTGGHRHGGLLLVGTPDAEPWHFAAHLADEARWAGLPVLDPTWVRWNPPPGAPPHLAVGIDRIAAAGRGETLLVATPGAADDRLLERVDDARRHGALILAVEGTATELQELAHEGLEVDAAVGYEVTTHLVSVSAARPVRRATRFRDQFTRLLGRVSGPHRS